MSSSQSLREFIRERLTAAAAEIFSEFEQTIVRYEEEIDRQRRLLEISWKPQINLHRIERPLHDVRNEEVQTDQQLWNQERTSSLEQEQPEPLPILEQEELCVSQDEEQFVLKQETATYLVTPADEDRDHRGPEPDRHQLLLSPFPDADIRAAAPPGSTEVPQHHVWEKEEVLTDQQLSNQTVTSSLDQKEPESPLIKEEQQELCIHQHEGRFMMISPSEETEFCQPEPNRNQPLCQSSTEVENQDQDGCMGENSESNSNEDQTQSKSQQTKDHRDGVDNKMKTHKRARREEKSFLCKFCGKSFTYKCLLTIHMRTHSGEKPFRCETCGKYFSQNNNLTSHMRTHKSEKPYSCESCGKSFTARSNLTKHKRIHSGEKPFSCETCGKSFTDSSTLTKHIRTHTGEKPYSCKTCGRCFSRSNHLTSHMKTQHR
nr:zinc finger and SCAN domain-containing protein 21 [Nothobranchius furzeri]